MIIPYGRTSEIVPCNILSIFYIFIFKNKKEKEKKNKVYN